MRKIILIALLILAIAGLIKANYVAAQPQLLAINLSMSKVINGAFYQGFFLNSAGLVKIDIISNSTTSVYVIPLNELSNYTRGELHAYFSGTGNDINGDVFLPNGSYALLIRSNGLVLSKTLVYDGVNPLEAVRSDMAMGIADYGVSLSNGSLVLYKYNCTGLMGNVTIIKADSASYGIQLNGNLETNGSIYFIQDALDYYHGKIIGIINVWNESGPSLKGPLINERQYLYASRVLGNASLPLIVTLMDNIASNGSGYYLIIKLRSSGQDWQLIIKLPGPARFIVNGGALTPFRGLYDAELVIGGSGNSSIASFRSLIATMSLFIINGTSIYMPPSAWNFGADTMEGTQNVTSRWSDGSAMVTLGIPSFNELYTTVAPPNLTMHVIIINNETYSGVAYQYMEVIIILFLFWIIVALISKKSS